MEPVAEGDMNVPSSTAAWEKSLSGQKISESKDIQEAGEERLMFPFWTLISVEILIWAAKRSAHLKDYRDYNIRKERSVTDQHRQTHLSKGAKSPLGVHTFAKCSYECQREMTQRYAQKPIKKAREVSQVLHYW